MNYDFVISDFDGTLLSKNDRISLRTVKAIKNFTDAGGIFGISTGRSHASIVQRLSELGIKNSFPVMSCQGALSKESVSDKTLARIPLDKTAAVEFLRRAENSGLMCQFYTDDKVYAEGINEINREYFERNRIIPEKVDNVVIAAQDCKEPILKVLCIIDPSRRAEMLCAFSGIGGAKVFASHALLIEAVSKDAGKDNGLKLACKRLGIDISRTIALGDELNDIDMIKTAGLGVAMANAVPEVKAAADYITDTCDNDGVAIVLEKIINNEI